MPAHAVTVKVKFEHLVSSISLNPTTNTLITGRTETLTPTVLPADAFNKTLEWTSSDDTVATVTAGGVVTALKSGGSVTITAAATDNSGESATCAITVTTSAVSVNFTSIADETINLTGNTEDDLSRSAGHSLTAAVGGEWVSYSWILDGGDVLSYTTAEVTFPASMFDLGVHRLSAVVTNAAGKSYSKELMFRVVQ
jgi:transglutaminase/protease-like cytokinesis protein 3